MAPVIKGSQINVHEVEDYSPHRFVREKQQRQGVPTGAPIFEGKAPSGPAWAGEESFPGFEKLLDIQARLRFLLKEIQEYSTYKK